MSKWLIAFLAFGFLGGCNNHQQSPNNSGSMDSLVKRPVSWAATTNIYEVNLRQYTTEGTFKAFEREMPRLKQMGVQTLWFMPITPIATKNMKGKLGSPYAASDYTAINPEFGTLDDFKHLVNTAHGLGFKVIIDWVANHTGWNHRWTTEHPDYYLHDPATNDFKIASGMDDIIELDYGNPALRKAMIEAMQYWVKETDIDGFRCDLAAWVEVDFWKEARPQVDAVKHLFWLGEFDELENPEYGKVFDASYCWTWMHRTRDFYQQHLPLASLDSLLERYNLIGDSSMRAWFTTNHDENSWNGTEYDKYGDMAPALAVFSATWNGVPLLYSGQEMPNRKKLAFFEKDTIEWSGDYALNDFYYKLLNLHATHPAMRGGDPAVQTYRIRTSEDDKGFVYLRKNGDREVLVALNFSKDKAHLTLDGEHTHGSFTELFSGKKQDFDHSRTLELEPWGYYVFVK